MRADRPRHTIALIEGLAAVFFFALTLPLSLYAVREIPPVTLGIGRGAIAGTLAMSALLLTRQRFPTRREWLGIAAMTPGIVYMFPVLVAWAMQYTSSTHGAIVVGLLPLCTAIFAALFGFEHPPLPFWLAALAGSAAVIGYSLMQGGGSLTLADLALLLAVVGAGISYCVGGRVARTLGGWQTISWMSAVNLPVTASIFGWMIARDGFHASPSATGAFIFMGIFSQYVAFFWWYQAMARVGVNRVSQLQLLQPFITLIIAAAFLSEVITWDTLVALALVMGSVVVARKMAPAIKPVSASS